MENDENIIKMNTHKELSFEWNILFTQKYDQWTKTDLQLAAELGKTLLERNKELEIQLKEHKNTIDEQEQEIVYLKKHTTALREVNDSRLKVYEQLEVGIQDLERANHRLHIENTTDKKHIKTLAHNAEALEARFDEVNKLLEETRQSLSMERRKNERLMQEKNDHINEAANKRLRPTEQNDFAKANNNDKSGNTCFDANKSAAEDLSFALQQSPDQQTNRANSTKISTSNSSFSGDGSKEIFDLSIVDAAGGCSEENEEIIRLVNDLDSTKRAFLSEQQRCTELEEQLVAIIQENQSLHGRIEQTSTNEEMRSMHDELSILDEVRQGQMCSRCLRTVDDRVTLHDEQSSIAPTEEEVDDDERSLMGIECAGGNNNSNAGIDDNASENSQANISAYRSNASGSIKITSNRIPDHLDLSDRSNPYRDLVEKYEALLEVQRSSIARKQSNGLSLAEEFQASGEFNTTQKLMLEAAAAAVAANNCAASSNGDNASSCNGSLTNDANKTKDVRGRTPTEFSEAETSSSGYSDETSNKYTQTDDRPGYFLCTIGDGEDCKFSIYDDASPIDSRFRNRPEYRQLFKEIFAVLKKAAENKEEGDKLPLLDDAHPINNNNANNNNQSAKVPPVTPANEELPVDFGDDTQSIISSAVSEQSFAMSECITKLERKTAKKHIIEKNQENQPPITMTTSITHLVQSGNVVGMKPIVENGRILTPLKREPLDYLTVGVGIKKKNRRKVRNFSTDRSESPSAIALPTPPRILVASGKKRKDARPLLQSSTVGSGGGGGVGGTANDYRNNGSRNNARFEWNGNSMVIYNRGSTVSPSTSTTSPQQQYQQNSPQPTRSREFILNGIEYRPSTVSQDLHKLKKLDLSYAEVLRRADACKQSHHGAQHYHHQTRRRNH